MKLLSTIMVLILFVSCALFSCKKDTPDEVQSTSSLLITNIASWSLASVPLRFAESNLTNNTAYGFNRAKFSWYNIDPTCFYDPRHESRPPNITKDDMSSDDCRVIYENDLFPWKENPDNKLLYINVFNVDYYPSERGPWNFDTSPSDYSAGISYEGYLNHPTTRWGGIMRKIEKSDMKLKCLDFWVLNPFTNFPEADGKLVFDMGQISEDVLKDGLISCENSAEGETIETVWGLVKPQSVDFSFPADLDRKKYDTGLDGLQNKNDNYYAVDENNYFKDYLEQINLLCGPSVYNATLLDPSGDDYHSFLGDDYDQLNYKVRDRYKNIREGENNSPMNEATTNSIGQRNPNTEDMNMNRIMQNANNYREYIITMNQESMQVGTNYLVEIFTNSWPRLLENGHVTYPKFYHFRIPLDEYSNLFGTPDVSANPESIRMYFTGFTSSINLRFIEMMFTNDLYEFNNKIFKHQ